MADLSSAFAVVSQLMVAELRTSMKAFGLDNTELDNSVEANARVSAAEVDISFNEYGKWVISGRKPGGKRVPVDALIKWIRSKGIRGRSANGRFISVNSLAWAIQNSIWKRGIKGKDFLTPAIDGALEEATNILIDALIQEFERE